MIAPGPEGFLARIPEPDGLPDWISRQDFDVYVDEFTRNGFTGPLNWYRCFDRNWELTAETAAATIDVPALFIGGTADATLAYTPRHRAREIVTGEYREVMIDGAGHWLTEERPHELSRDPARVPHTASVTPVVSQWIRSLTGEAASTSRARAAGSTKCDQPS